jgi:hypothetical protein
MATGSEDEQMTSMRNLASILHSVYFGTLHALKKEKSFFEVYEVAINGISDMLGGYFNLLEAQELDEVMENLEKTGIYNDLQLEEVGEDSYLFKIGDCKFAGGEEGVHQNVQGIDMPCPLALFVGSVLAKQDPSKKIYIYPTVYEDDSSSTQIDLIPEREFQERMDRLKNMA